MTEKKKNSKKTTKKKITQKVKKVPQKTAKRGTLRSEKVSEVFEVEKNKEEKIVKTKGTEEVKLMEKGQLEHQKKVLKNFFIGFLIIMGLIIGFYFYTQAQININYKGIKFQAVNEGTSENPLVMYRTITLLDSNDGTDALFGFRLRTNPRELKRIPFENLDDFELMKKNGYEYMSDFNCEGAAILSMVSLKRIFEKTGMEFLRYEGSSCDPEGRYNYFILKYGDKTEIKEIGPKCYELIIEGNDDKCEIQEVVEKLMVEIFVKYGEL